MKLFQIMDTSFNNFDKSVRIYLQKTFNDLGFNYTHNQIFGVIFDGIKGIMQNVMFYIEDAFTEQNIYTARRKKSVYSLAKLSGYEPYYGASATGTISCKLSTNNGLESKATKIYIQNGSTIRNKNTNIIYTIQLPTNYYIVDVSKPLVTHEFKIIQGTYRTSTYIGKGIELETINITGGSNYDSQYIEVLVDGEKWERVSNLYEMSENSKNYIIECGYDNTFNVIFGNGTFGKLLEQGQSVVIKYLNHSGLIGNISAYDEYKLEFLTTGTDTKGYTINLNDYLKLSINKIVSGGNNPDTIDIVKQMVGYNSRSSVLASEENFKLFLKRFSFMGQTSIWSEENSATVIISALTNFFNIKDNVEYYYTTPIEQFLLNDNQKNIIVETLNNSNKTFAGMTVKFQDPVIRKFAMICYVKVNTVYNQENVTDNIKNIVAEYFINIDNNIQFVAKSDLIQKICSSDENIKSFDFQFISDLAEQTFYNGYYYQYYLKYANKTYDYAQRKVFYEEGTYPGLDIYGNISLDTKLEIPLLRGGFKYYPDKTNKNNSIVVDAVQVFFI